MHSFVFESESIDDTRRLGLALGAVAEPGLVVALTGQLGAGKTAFTRAVAEGLQIADPRIVTSPTFMLIQEYPARLPVYHFDTYRLGQMAEFTELGAHEYFEDDGVCLVEWADRIAPLLPEDRLEVELRIEPPDRRQHREIACRCHGKRWAALFDAWRQKLQPPRASDQ